MSIAINPDDTIVYMKPEEKDQELVLKTELPIFPLYEISCMFLVLLIFTWIFFIFAYVLISICVLYL